MGKTPNDRQQAGGYATPIRIDSAKRAEKVESAKRVAIFELDGVTYDMPAAQRADIALTYLQMNEEEGEDKAAYYLLTETLGAGAYAALRGVKGLTDDDFEGVLTRVRAIALPKGQQPTATRTRD